MTARFKRNAEVRLLHEEEEEDINDDLEAESSLLSGEEDALGEGGVHIVIHDEKEDHKNLLSPSINDLSWWKSGRWKIWKHRKQYHVHSSSKSKFCKVNSWKAVFIALLAFTMAMVISILLSRLLAEPPLTPSTGKYIYIYGC